MSSVCVSCIQFRLNSIPGCPLRIEWQPDVISKDGISDDLIESLLIPVELRTIHRVRFSHNHDRTFPSVCFFDLPGGSDDVDRGTGVCDSLWGVATHSLTIVTLFGHKTNESWEASWCWFASSSMRSARIDSITRDWRVGPDLMRTASVPLGNCENCLRCESSSGVRISEGEDTL
jgi:hypothetical protein